MTILSKTLCINVLILFYALFIQCAVIGSKSKNTTSLKSDETPQIKKELFGSTRNGQSVEKYTLTNRLGMRIEVINYGGIIIRWTAPNRDGVYEDVVLGYNSLEKYIESNPYFGAIVGRFANRIAHGKFSLEGKEYSLAQNNGSNHLHGGLSGFDKAIWEVECLKNENGIQLSYTSKDGEEGYPGNLFVTVTYVLTDDNTLKVKYRAHTDITTVINLTQHSYFNLSGDFSKQILDHELYLNADQYLPLDNTNIPIGNLQTVADSPFDFRTPKIIGRDIEAKNDQITIGNGYDHCWVINNLNKKIVNAAEVYHPESGRVMEVYTDQPGIQLYTANYLNNKLASKMGGTYGARSGFCLETQHFPNSPNEPSFPTTILQPGETFTSETWFQFSVK
ncbi:aldose epimerase family protein [Carboxylicivirga sp. RSCT41]|uniref:aldose epimerase family protein n=1 Tax=Carboxylicivirga agarovorans TaxID=3417570 RepID=UPI003D3423C3